MLLQALCINYVYVIIFSNWGFNPGQHHCLQWCHGPWHDCVNLNVILEILCISIYVAFYVFAKVI